MRKFISTVIIAIGVGWVCSGNMADDTIKNMLESNRTNFGTGAMLGARLALTGKYKTIGEVYSEAIRRYDAWNAGDHTSMTNGF